MDKIVISPRKYVQGAGALSRIEQYTQKLGKKGLVIADDFVLGLVKDDVLNAYKDSEILIEEFNKECCMDEINKFRKVVVDNKIEFIVGIGGGKTIDTAKAVGYFEDIKVAAVPTVASTDAPTSSLSVIYTPTGEFEQYLFITNNPDLVLLDLSIIARAPRRLLAAGIGDALSTYFEARACSMSNAKTMAGGLSTIGALAIAKTCYETILRDGYNALISCDRNVVTPALENIVEANTYLSGIGFESSGLAACHAIHNGLTQMHSLHHLLHGEKVAFGVVVQLVLENDTINLEKVLEFNKQMGLPSCFKQMGVDEYSDEEITKVSECACAVDETIHNMPFKVTPQMVKAAIITADALGEEYSK